MSCGQQFTSVEQNQKTLMPNFISSIFPSFYVHQESIPTTFFERNCAIFFAPIKSLTFTSSTKKLRAKLFYKKAASKMLVKLTPG
jgi:hypothetical protein